MHCKYIENEPRLFLLFQVSKYFSDRSPSRESQIPPFNFIWNSLSFVSLIQASFFTEKLILSEKGKQEEIWASLMSDLAR